jgi:hypothetical protein
MSGEHPARPGRKNCTCSSDGFPRLAQPGSGRGFHALVVAHFGPIGLDSGSVRLYNSDST